MSVVVKYEIGVARNDAKRLCYVGAFNGVGFIIIPICFLKAEVDVVCVIGNLNIREVAHCAIMRRGWFVIFYKDAFAIEVGIFRSFFSDEVHFAGLKIGWGDKSKGSHWSSCVCLMFCDLVDSILSIQFYGMVLLHDEPVFRLYFLLQLNYFIFEYIICWQYHTHFFANTVLWPFSFIYQVRFFSFNNNRYIFW